MSVGVVFYSGTRLLLPVGGACSRGLHLHTRIAVRTLHDLSEL